jgi:hypothetical protein
VPSRAYTQTTRHTSTATAATAVAPSASWQRRGRHVHARRRRRGAPTCALAAAAAPALLSSRSDSPESNTPSSSFCCGWVPAGGGSSRAALPTSCLLASPPQAPRVGLSSPARSCARSTPEVLRPRSVLSAVRASSTAAAPPPPAPRSLPPPPSPSPSPADPAPPPSSRSCCSCSCWMWSSDELGRLPDDWAATSSESASSAPDIRAATARHGAATRSCHRRSRQSGPRASGQWLVVPTYSVVHGGCGCACGAVQAAREVSRESEPQPPATWLPGTAPGAVCVCEWIYFSLRHKSLTVQGLYRVMT